jgi:hypothetical protein
MRRSILVLWLGILALGFGYLMRYSGTAGEPAQAQAMWPTASHAPRVSNRYVLVTFGHPRCPCTRATIGELERLVPHFRERVTAMVYFENPNTGTPNWRDEMLWNSVQAIPGVTVSYDEDSREARLFGARTSGQTFLYSPEGQLLFSGGITPERGHMGDSVGRAAILQAIRGDTWPVQAIQTPVYGCSLKKPERAPATETPL